MLVAGSVSFRCLGKCIGVCACYVHYYMDACIMVYIIYLSLEEEARRFGFACYHLDNGVLMTLIH